MINSTNSIEWTEIENEFSEDIPSLENILESKITSNEKYILDDLGLQIKRLIDQENVSSNPKLERMIENDLEDQYLNNFSQSDAQVDEEELFNSDFLQDIDLQNKQVLI